jgi:hypothetical protein
MSGTSSSGLAVELGRVHMCRNADERVYTMSCPRCTFGVHSEGQKTETGGGCSWAGKEDAETVAVDGQGKKTARGVASCDWKTYYLPHLHMLVASSPNTSAKRAVRRRGMGWWAMRGKGEGLRRGRSSS